MTTALANTVHQSATDDGEIQPLQRSDIRPVADLLSRVFLQPDGPPIQAICNYMEAVFFSDPWRKLNVSPSLVYKDRSGEVRGFFGAHPRRFVLGGDEITAVVIGQFAVDPLMRGRGVGLRLATAIAAGPQTITFTTSANPASASVCRRVGCWHPPFAGLQFHKGLWTGGGKFARLIRPVKKVFTRPVPGSAENGRSGLSCRPIADAAELHELRGSLATAHALCSDFDREHTEWLWRMLHDSPTQRQLRTCVMLDDSGAPTGWAVYFVNSDQTARLLEFVSLPGQYHAVLAALFTHMSHTDIKLVIGFCNTPELTAAAAKLGSSIKSTFSGWAIHCSNPDVRHAILNGQVFWSELDGETWVNFRTV